MNSIRSNILQNIWQALASRRTVTIETLTTQIEQTIQLGAYGPRILQVILVTT